MTYLLGELLNHRKFPPELVVAASGKDPSNLASALPINSYAQDDTVSANILLQIVIYRGVYLLCFL